VDADETMLRVIFQGKAGQNEIRAEMQCYRAKWTTR
jgi:hypothetical protein